jgi:hypothetical protein
LQTVGEQLQRTEQVAPVIEALRAQG